MVVSFTKGVIAFYNPDEPEFTTESLGYNPLESTGREWNYHPLDEFIYQEYSDRGHTPGSSYMPSRNIAVRVIDACSPQEKEETRGEQRRDDRAMAWKSFRPSTCHTIWKSLYTGTLISLLTATIIGSLFSSFTYLSYETVLDCPFHSIESIPSQIQWMKCISGILSSAFVYMWFPVSMLLLFRPYQLIGVKMKLALAAFSVYCLDTLYRVGLQAFEVLQSKAFTSPKLPLNFLFLLSVCLQVYLVTSHFSVSLSRRQRVYLFLQLILPSCFSYIVTFITIYTIYPAYNKQKNEGKLLIAILAPLVGFVLKVICRISVQRLRNVTHPGYSYVLLAPLYFGSAIVFRVLQADLDSLQSMAILGIVHGISEVLERSFMVIIDHYGHVIWKRTSAPWGSFRTPRRERLMADIAIMSMLFESIGIVSVNGVLYLYEAIYLHSDPLVKLLQSFAIRTSILLVIEWFFTSMSLAIVIHYQNMAVVAVWRKRWRRHTFVAVVCAVPLALWTSGYLLEILHGRFKDTDQPCRMPFS